MGPGGADPLFGPGEPPPPGGPDGPPPGAGTWMVTEWTTSR